MTVGAGEQPYRGDARFKEFVDKLSYDLELAKRRLEILHSGGKGESLRRWRRAALSALTEPVAPVDLMHTKSFFGFVERHPTATVFSDLREKLHRVGGGAVEFFAAHGGVQDLIRREAAKDRLLMPDSDQTTGESQEDLYFPSHEEAASSRGGGGRAEKAECRARWLKILARLEQWHDGKARGILSQAVSIVEDASLIPMPFAVALHSSAGSSAQAQEDQEQIEHLRSLIGDLLKRIVETQKWLADARDMVFRKTFW